MSEIPEWFTGTGGTWNHWQQLQLRLMDKGRGVVGTEQEISLSMCRLYLTNICVAFRLVTNFMKCHQSMGFLTELEWFKRRGFCIQAEASDLHLFAQSFKQNMAISTPADWLGLSKNAKVFWRYELQLISATRHTTITLGSVFSHLNSALASPLLCCSS